MGWLQQQQAMLWVAAGHMCTCPGRKEIGASQQLPVGKQGKETHGIQSMVQRGLG